ncbi:MAG: hypothetical protein QXU69_04095 [Thermofilaceae archaeon]
MCIDVEVFRLFGAYIVTMIAMEIAGFDVPGLVKINLNLFWVKFFIVIIGLLYSMWSHVKKSAKQKGGQSPASNVYDIISLMFLLLILPSLDGNIFTLSTLGCLNIFSNPQFIIPLAFTILSGPGSWSLAAQLGAAIGWKDGLKYVLLGGGACTLCAVGATILGQIFKGAIPISFSFMAAIAVFVSSILIWYKGKPPGQLESIPPSIIFFALILSLISTHTDVSLMWIACIIALLAILFASKTNHPMAAKGLCILLIPELISAYFIGLETASKMIIFTHTPFILIVLPYLFEASIRRLLSILEKRLKGESTPPPATSTS